METLYDLLGALPNDDAESLRAAFRRAVKRAHPDVNPGDPDAGLKFRRIVRANEILGDVEQRAAYDHLLEVTRIEQEHAAKHAVTAKIHKLASGVSGAGRVIGCRGRRLCVVSATVGEHPYAGNHHRGKQAANRQLSSLLDLPEKSRQAHQPRRKHPGTTSPPPGFCRQLRAHRLIPPSPRVVASDHSSTALRSTPRNSSLPTSITASYFMACANLRAPLPRSLRPSTFKERASLPRHHRAFRKSTTDNPLQCFPGIGPRRAQTRKWLASLGEQLVADVTRGRC
jgi:curved DNA-binding protein CbpA